ncbi:hypothetical protein DU508_18925 [Pedobacter chinensis]|uniref:Uncharacterized protein n=1 Tax=Pedobacter chinensis TaxID=2282421 RepID=A0A369PRF0_9SPHI|nr:hypothetical protein [Pedobacter chinensis]RDC54892.1 hypothetical protein DU508_18925 [Pedobacter chinensis]
MRIELPETYKGFTLITENIQMITNGRNTSYVFPVKLNSARAITFQNLTIVESANGISAFVTSYTPTREWIKNWRDGKPRKFDGDIAVTPLYLENGSMPTVLSLNTSLKNKKLNSLAPVTKTSLAAPGCTEYTFYYAVAYQCGSGNHWPGDPNCTLTGAGAAGYANLSSTTTICTGEGGGGGTTPTPDPDYNPCPEAPSPIDFRGVRGERLAVAEGTTPCDLQPLPPAPILMPPPPDIPIVDMEKFLKCFDKVSLQILPFMQKKPLHHHQGMHLLKLHKAITL